MALKSLLHRKGSVALTIFAISISVIVILGIDHLRLQTKNSFTKSTSGVDLIIGTRSSEVNLLLYSVFRIGSPTSNISWQSYQRIKADKSIKWSFPISLGDSHRGYRVLGTTKNYFDFFSYGEQQSLKFKNGQPFDDVFDVVLGAKAAQNLGYMVGDKITLSHGIGATSFTHHKHMPFIVTGILAPTGTPTDQTLFVGLQGIEAIHITEPFTGNTNIVENLKPKSITAFMVGLQSKMAIFNFQRKINTDKLEPLSAILPGVALANLWQAMSMFDNSLQLISAIILVSSLIGLSAILLSSIRERREEISLLRIIGASPSFIFCLIQLEALLITLLSIVLALLALNITLPFLKAVILNNYGVEIETIMLPKIEMVIGLFIFTFIAATPPAIKAFIGAKNTYV